VVVCWVVLAGRTAVVSCVVVVVVAAGSFTTVVHEVKTIASSARTGVRMISFLIVVFGYKGQFALRPLVSRIWRQVFRNQAIVPRRRRIPSFA
jgi:hypothetical protein